MITNGRRRRPQSAVPNWGVDSFLRLIEGRYRELEKGCQLAVEKL
jgi:hypothetical protein